MWHWYSIRKDTLLLPLCPLSLAQSLLINPTLYPSLVKSGPEHELHELWSTAIFFLLEQLAEGANLKLSSLYEAW